MTRYAFVLVTGISFAIQPASAGSGGFFATYDSEVAKGEVELMLMTDYTSPSKHEDAEGVGRYVSQMLELEYGFTEQLAAEVMLEWFQGLEEGRSKFTGARIEARYRLFARDVPLNPMVYAEYEHLDHETRYKMEVSGWVDPPYEAEEEPPRDERIMETRLVLSDELGPVDVAFNWINETDLRSGSTDFGYCLGVSRDVDIGRPALLEGEAVMEPGASHAHGGEVHGALRLGLELYGGLGDTESLAFDLDRQQHYLGPTVALHLTEKLMVHAQAGIGLSDASDDLVRLSIGYGF